MYFIYHHLSILIDKAGRPVTYKTLYYPIFFRLTYKNLYYPIFFQNTCTYKNLYFWILDTQETTRLNKSPCIEQDVIKVELPNCM